MNCKWLTPEVPRLYIQQKHFKTAISNTSTKFLEKENILGHM